MASLILINPEYLWLLLLVPTLFLLQFYGYKFVRKRTLRFANVEALERALGVAPKISKGIVILILRIFALAALVFALANPVFYYSGKVGDFDCIFAIDVSGSMLATDFKPNRLEAAKNAAVTVLGLIPRDSRIGVVSFSGIPMVKQRLTRDRVKVLKAIESMNIEPISGTAIGDALITSANIFSGEKAQLIILVTDGQNTVGTMLDDAISYLKKSKIIVHSIGIATEEGSAFTDVPAITKLDTEALEKLSQETGGTFFIAENLQDLKSGFEHAIRLKEGNIPVKLAPFLLFASLFVIVLEWGFINTRYRRIP